MTLPAEGQGPRLQFRDVIERCMPDMENGCRRGRVVQSRNCGGVEWLGPTHASRGRLAAASPPGMGIFLQSDRQGRMEDWRRIVQDRAVSLRKGGVETQTAARALLHARCTACVCGTRGTERVRPTERAGDPRCGLWHRRWWIGRVGT